MKTFKMRLTGIDGTTFAIGNTKQELVDYYNRVVAGGDIPQLTIDDLDDFEWMVEEGLWTDGGKLIIDEIIDHACSLYRDSGIPGRSRDEIAEAVEAWFSAGDVELAEYADAEINQELKKIFEPSADQHKTLQSVQRLGDGQCICSACWAREWPDKAEPEINWVLGSCDFC